jgi:hypothetical protein
MSYLKKTFSQFFLDQQQQKYPCKEWNECCIKKKNKNNLPYCYHIINGNNLMKISSSHLINLHNDVYNKIFDYQFCIIMS